jgi:hypothetical protein
MIKKLLIGPLLTVGGWLAGSYYGASAEQLVHKDPATTYAAVDGAIANAPQSGTMKLEGGQPVPYAINVDRSDGERLVVHLLLDGREGAMTELRFAPHGGGGETLITARVHGDRTVLGAALAGTDKARLAWAPDWMLNLAAKPLLRQLAEQIDSGEAVAAAPGFLSQADWESQLPAEEQKQVQLWRQYDASRPMVDPNESANAFLGNGE